MCSQNIFIYFGNLFQVTPQLFRNYFMLKIIKINSHKPYTKFIQIIHVFKS